MVVSTKSKVELPNQTVLLCRVVLRAGCLKFTITLGTKKKLVMGVTRGSLELGDCGLWRHIQH